MNQPAPVAAHAPEAAARLREALPAVDAVIAAGREGLRAKVAAGASEDGDALRKQVSELKSELGRRDSEVSELTSSRQSLQKEVVNLKSLLDSAGEDFSLRHCLRSPKILRSTPQTFHRIDSNISFRCRSVDWL